MKIRILYSLVVLLLGLGCSINPTSKDDSIKIVAPENYDFNLIPNQLNEECSKFKYSELIKQFEKYDQFNDSIRYELDIWDVDSLPIDFELRTVVLTESIKTIGIGERKFEMYLTVYHIVKAITKNDEIVYAKTIQENDFINIINNEIKGEVKGLHKNPALINEFESQYEKYYKKRPKYDELIRKN